MTAMEPGSMHQCAPSPHSSRGSWTAVFIWTVILWAVLGGMQLWWVHHDTRPQECDPATYLRRALRFGQAMHNFSLREMWRAWRAEYGLYTYPPLFHIVTGALSCVLKSSAAL